MSLPTILLTAGTGKVGAALTALLAKDDRIGQVRIGTRHPRGQAAQLLAAYAPGKVIPVAFDPADGHGMRNALSGVERLVLIVPLVEDMTAWQRKILDAAPNTLGAGRQTEHGRGDWCRAGGTTAIRLAWPTGRANA